MKVCYSEGPDALTVPAAGVVAQRGQAVDVPAEVGKQLLEQGWEKADKAASKKEAN